MIFPNIQLREYGCYVGQFEPSEVETLAKFQGKIDVYLTDQPGWYQVWAKSYVGFVRLPTGRLLSIEPKIPIETLFALMDAVYDPSRDFHGPQDYTTTPGLFEFIVGFYISYTEDLIARGILRGYQTFHEDIAAVRGKVLLTETLKHRPGLYDRHQCGYRQFTPDILENRILLWTALCLRGYPYRRAELSTHLERIIRTFAAVEIDPFAQRLFDTLDFHRLNNYYRPALQLARLLLAHLTFSGSVGENEFLAFFIDMNWLFEKYLGVVLRDNVRKQGYIVREQVALSLDLANKIKVSPDILLYQEGQPVLIIDAKYKRNADQDDVYQMIAYCHALQLQRAILIHPLGEQSLVGDLSIRGEGDLHIHYLNIDLRGGITELRKQGIALSEQVLSFSNQQLATL